ncbi:transmembrane sensor [Dysgonomonas sp. PFB1-18]|uniref:FecR family protein n=1 Tax=unclassified Dysgonomonas TaxID=2630389 RepID=UPI002473E0FA|nr:MULTISPECIES: FecR family protein [unclassified Dysgonomonas]MDH6311193.1 transmembrane sensor [Dysgonomonas sp. PF1-14]MDH6341073.1 transmembrane sensor [Dysgonomonas sp. PF1-16]MDH6382774.1 transmembrane sensor [Dysgonomonas sp. PFB1-18]MDH6400065.1 transmembrane sensor [Dysgonomonas sp. PF1-23]
MNFELLYKFFEGQTTKEEEESIRIWLNSSPENKKYFLEERKVYDAIILNSEEQTEKLSINYNVNNDSTKLFSRIPIHFREFIKVAAIITITILASWFFFSQNDGNSNAMAEQTISVPAGQRLNITLPDGTDVWLNAKTTIRYPVSFNTKERLVSIDGQAYFDVAKNEKVPFIVKSPSGTVQALGTKFDILDYSDSGIYETMLMEGSVKINLVDDANQEVILTPDKKTVLDKGRLQTIEVSDLSAYQWKDGLISFKNESFENIMRSFEKTYDIKIVVENKNIGNRVFTGKFRIIDGVEYALRVLQRDVNFRFERDVERHIIYIK